MNRKSRRQFDRYAKQNGIPAAIDKFLHGEEKRKAIDVQELMQKRILEDIKSRTTIETIQIFPKIEEALSEIARL